MSIAAHLISTAPAGGDDTAADLSDARFDQEGECLCLVPDIAEEPAVGSVLESTGLIRISQATGFNPAAAGTAIFRNDRIIIGSESSVLIFVKPDCRRRIWGNTDVAIDSVDPKQICVRLLDRRQPLTVAQKMGRVVIGGLYISGWTQFKTPVSN